MLSGPDTTAGRAGPKAAAVLANITCELAGVVTDTTELAYYDDDATLTPGNYRHDQNHDPTRLFTLQNIFNEIKYVGEAEVTFDVQGFSSLTPSFSVIASPAEAANVGAQLGELSHRQYESFLSFDFSRLPPLKVVSTPQGNKPCKELRNVYSDSELGGPLGMMETIATGIQLSVMNKASLYPDTQKVPDKLPLDDPGKYTFGEIIAQVDYTTTLAANAGPALTYSSIKVPVGNQTSSNFGLADQGLVNLERQSKDSIRFVFVPACIRKSFRVCQPAPNKRCTKDSPVLMPDKIKTLKPPFEYYPELAVGTPPWANYLPQCSDDNKTAELRALGSAQQQLILLDSDRLRPVR